MSSIAMDISDDYFEGEEDNQEYIRPDYFTALALLLDQTAYVLADLLDAQDELAGAVAEALVTVEAPSDGHDCPICLQEDDTAAWKETPCGHRFHGLCVERWLQAKGSCPVCRSQVITMPTAVATSSALGLELPALLEFYRQVIIANSASMEDE